MCEIYLCEFCESCSGHINLYCINFCHAIHKALEHINKNCINLSRGPCWRICHTHKMSLYSSLKHPGYTLGPLLADFA